MKTKFFTFIQNNSFGYFVEDKKRKIDKIVIIEAENAKNANRRAKLIGLYFNGVKNGRDCPCCGDRWDKVKNRDGTDTPEVFGQAIKISDKNQHSYHSSYFLTEKPGYIHYLNDSYNTSYFTMLPDNKL